MGLSNIKASDGTGEAVRASVTAIRAPGSTTLSVDALTHWPDEFIATSGTLLPDGTLDPSSALVFEGHKSGSQIIIDTMAPGYTDAGNSVSQVVLIKPTTHYADTVADTLLTSLNDDGSLNDAALQQVLGSGYTAEDLRITPRIVIFTSEPTVTPAVDTHNYIRITAQAANLTIANHTGTPLDGEGLLIEIQDNGTSRTITWGTGYIVDSIYGLSLPTSTVAGKTHFLTFIWNEALAKYVAVL